MYQVVHGLSGVLIGSQTKNPVIAFILGVVSHFILDAIPHDSLEIHNWQDNGRGEKMKKFVLEASLDLFLFLSIILILIYTDKLKINMPVVAGVTGTLLPDYVWAVAELFKIKNTVTDKYKQFHNWVHGIFYKPVYLPGKYVIPIQLGGVIFFILLYLLL